MKLLKDIKTDNVSLYNSIMIGLQQAIIMELKDDAHGVVMTCDEENIKSWTRSSHIFKNNKNEQ